MTSTIVRMSSSPMLTTVEFGSSISQSGSESAVIVCDSAWSTSHVR